MLSCSFTASAITTVLLSLASPHSAAERVASVSQVDEHTNLTTIEGHSRSMVLAPDSKTETRFRARASDAFKGVRISDYFRSLHEARLDHMFYYQIYWDDRLAGPRAGTPANLANAVRHAEEFMRALTALAESEAVRAGSEAADQVRLAGLLMRVKEHLMKRDYVPQSCKLFFLKSASHVLSASNGLESIPYGCPCRDSNYCESGLTCKSDDAGIVTTRDDHVDAVPKLLQYMKTVKQKKQNLKQFTEEFEASGQTLRKFVMETHKHDWNKGRAAPADSGEDVLAKLRSQFVSVGICAPSTTSSSSPTSRTSPSSPTPSSSLPEGWEQHTDQQSGKPYYYNPATGQSTWDSPSSGLPSVWQQHTDPTSGKPYYYNPTTGESAWDLPLPEGWKQHIDPATGNPFYFNESTGETRWDRPS